MRLHTRRAARNAGFTLMELVVVMTIIAILAGAVMIQVNKNIQHARRARALQDIATLDTALGIYEAHNGFPPSQEQGLGALISQPSGTPTPKNWQGPYLKRKSVPKDPWGNEYVYTVSGSDYQVISYAADNQAGGAGDGADVVPEE